MKIIKESDSSQKIIGQMKINEYKINQEFSAALVDINGDHGKLVCTDEDRIYFILDGKGKFIIGNEESEVGPCDLIFIPKNTPYNIIGIMKYFLVCAPEFDPKHDVFIAKAS
jgi:mannose-6-phosphate isomerase-like protein (cupin superfamily)